MRRRLLWALAIVGLMALVTAAPAFAYYESSQTVGPAGTPAWSCQTCHGREEGATSPTVAPRIGGESEAGLNVGTRKGPHGGYTTGANKCELCHFVHSGPVSSFLLLRSQTVIGLCYMCHDGTGGSGVYGVIQARTGQPAGGQHRIETTTAPAGMVVPGGAATGGSSTAVYSGSSGSLTCTDCHSPHNVDCVKPFIGDRKRTEDDTTFASIATNHLLKQKPGRSSEVTAVVAYGSDWCEVCHAGRHSGTGGPINHSVADTTTAPGWDYTKVNKAAGFNTGAVATGALGGDNFGYVSSPTWREQSGGQKYPICQQCHEDSRNVGDATQYQITSPATPIEAFTVTSPDGLSSTDNPRFQNFPHETENAQMVLETGDDLCLNCHSIRNMP